MKGEIAVEGRVNPVSEKKKHTHNQITGKGILASVSLVILVVLMFCITTVTIAEDYRVKSDHGSYSDTNNHEPPHFSTHVVFFVLQKLLLLCKTFFVKVNLAKTRAHLLSARPDCVISPQHLAILQPPPSSLL